MGKLTKLNEARGDVFSERNEGLHEEEPSINEQEWDKFESENNNDASEFFIHEEMMKYVKDNALPLCEYLTVDELRNFMDNQ